MKQYLHPIGISLMLALLGIQAVDSQDLGSLARETSSKVDAQAALERDHYQGNPADYQRPIVHLCRFQLDVTGDGTPELFAGSTHGADTAVDWVVYDGAQPDRLLAKDLSLDPRHIYQKAGPDGHTISQIGRNEDGGYLLKSYHFGTDGAFEVRSRPADLEERDRLRKDQAIKKATLGEARQPSVEIVLLDAFLRDPSTKWRPWDRERSALAQLNREDEVVLRQLSKPVPESAAIPINAQGSPTPISTPVLEKPAGKPVPELPQQAGIDHLLLQLAALAAGALLAAWLCLKRTRATRHS